MSTAKLPTTHWFLVLGSWWSKRASPQEPQIFCCQRGLFTFRLASQYTFWPHGIPSRGLLNSADALPSTTVRKRIDNGEPDLRYCSSILWEYDGEDGILFVANDRMTDNHEESWVDDVAEPLIELSQQPGIQESGEPGEERAITS
jgi:hypothetical protein